MQPDRNSERSADDVICSDSAAYVYGGLSDARREAFEIHLRTCSACRQFADDIRSILGDIAASDTGDMAREAEDAQPLFLARYVQKPSLHGLLKRHIWIEKGLLASCILLMLAMTTMWIRLAIVESARDKLSQEASALHRTLDNDMKRSGYIVDQIVDLHAAAQGGLSDGLAVIIAGGGGMRFFLEAEKLPAPGGNEVYHVWLDKDGRSVHAGIFPMSGGTGAFHYKGLADHYDRIFVSLEPSPIAGSSPIGRIVLTGALSS